WLVRTPGRHWMTPNTSTHAAQACALPVTAGRGRPRSAGYLPTYGPHPTGGSRRSGERAHLPPRGRRGRPVLGGPCWPRPDGRSVPRPRGWLSRVLRDETAPESGAGAGQLTAGLALILGWLAGCRLVKPLGWAGAHAIPARLPGSAASWTIAGAWLPGQAFAQALS